MAFSFDLRPQAVPQSALRRDFSFIDGLADRFQQNRKDEKTAQAIGEYSQGLDPALAKEVAPLLRDPSTRAYGLQMIRDRTKPKELPSGVQEYLYGLQDPGYAQHQLNMKLAGRNVNNVNVGYEKAFDKTLAEGYAKTFLGTQDDARAGQRSLNSLQAMEGLISQPGFYSGTGGEGVLALKRLGASVGMDPEGITSMESFNALSKQAALDAMGGSLGTGFSNADRDFVVGQVAGLGNTPEGNKQIIGIQRKIQQRKIDIGRVAREYSGQNGGMIDAGFDAYLADWAEKNPLFDQSSAKKAPQASGADPAQSGQPARINSKQEMDALPSGTRFIAPDGSIRIKP